jgi:hypothetical protein
MVPFRGSGFLRPGVFPHHLETIERSHTLWKSDETGSLPVMRFQETGGNVFLPGVLLKTELLPKHVPYECPEHLWGAFGFPM